MSKCMTCKYALYDGMCLAQGKFTLLDAQACDDYKPRIDFEASQLKAENAKLRELVDILCFCMQVHKRCDDCKLNGAKGELGLGHDPLLACDGLHEMLKELGIKVDA